MTENPTTAPACLDDDEGVTLRVYPWASGRVSLVALDGDQGTEFGPVERHVLLDAIREVAGETDDKPKPAPVPSKSPTAEDFAKAQFATKAGLYGAVRSRSGFWRTESGYVRADARMAAEGWSIVTPAPSTPREALALAADLAYEVEGDTMPDQPGYMTVGEDGGIDVYSDGNPCGKPARGIAYRRLLLDPPAPVTPAWHNARIVEATCRGRVGQWARTATGGLWVSLDGESREAYTPDLTDVSIVVPEEVEA